MGILGKILLVVNLLVGGGFAFLAIQDFFGEKGKGNGRQNITAGGLRFSLLARGLPFDGGPDALPAPTPDEPDPEIPFKVEQAGGTTTTTVGTKVLTAYFKDCTQTPAPAGGEVKLPPFAVDPTTPVTCQTAELKRVYGVLKRELDAADGPAAKAKLAAGWLLPLAESYAERVAVLTAEKADDADELLHRLTLKFYAAYPPLVTSKVASLAPNRWPDDLAAAADEAEKKFLPLEAEAAKTEAEAKKDATGDPAVLMQKAWDLREQARPLRGQADALRRAAADGKATDPGTRQTRLAHLLVFLDQDATWQKRVAMVVGLKNYVPAVAAQVPRLDRMIAFVDQQVRDDNDKFVPEYTLLRRLAIQRTMAANDVLDARVRVEQLRQNDADLAARRGTALGLLQKELEKVKAETDGLLARQTTLERQLFEVQREVGVTLDEIYRLEDELRRTEREKLGFPKK